MSCWGCCPENKWVNPADLFVPSEHGVLLHKSTHEEGRSIQRYQEPCQQPLQKEGGMFERCISPNLAPALEAEEATIASSV